MHRMSTDCRCIRIVVTGQGRRSRLLVTIHNMCYRTLCFGLLLLRGRSQRNGQPFETSAKVVFRVVQEVALHNYHGVAHR